MSEYLVTFKATIPGFFSSRSIEESNVYEANSAKDVMEIAREDMKHQMRLKGIFEHELEEQGITLTITDVKKI